ncbi:hypothetical protein GA0074692_5305 [Micromonospora pallida]|uniref:Core-binding (CB) domain-containing protein n=1 Tax=Micromonospora pallida TaxID=145854 RepID=A0A1C6TCJ2_9ACTN|nr:hypothetical protein GA0074692_5305 [Micromonospora pallida]
MATLGVIFKRCGCRDNHGRRLERRCPRLGDRFHGTWYFHCCASNVLGRSERVRRGGYPSQAAARRARDKWLAATEAQRTASGWTVERWLRHWLDQHTQIRPTTRLHYTRDVERVLIPHLGQYRLADLDARLLRTVFDQIARTTNTKGLPQSASAMQHLRTTLRAALNLAVKQELIEGNPARHITVAGYRKPHAQVWTDDRVRAWQTTGEHPTVAVWTAEQLGTFLDTVTDDPLFAFWWLTALRGLRRGEVCGLRWTEVDLDRGVLYVERNRTTAGYQVIEGSRKPPPDADPSPWTNVPPRSCANTDGSNEISKPAARQRGNPGSTPATYSSARMAAPSTLATPAAASGYWSNAQVSRRSDCTTCATAPRPSPTKPAPTSRPCRTCSDTPASWSPPTPTPASCPSRSAAAPTPPPTSSSPPPAAPAPRSERRATATGPSPDRRHILRPARHPRSRGSRRSRTRYRPDRHGT